MLELASELSDWNPVTFRRDLASVLESGKSAALASNFEGPLTGMAFKGFENRASLTVFELAPSATDPDLLVASPLERPPPAWHRHVLHRLHVKANLVLHRYGYTPLAIVLFLAALSFYISFRDVRRWYGGSWKPVLRSSWFLGFALFQMPSWSGSTCSWPRPGAR